MIIENVSYDKPDRSAAEQWWSGAAVEYMWMKNSAPWFCHFGVVFFLLFNGCMRAILCNTALRNFQWYCAPKGQKRNQSTQKTTAEEQILGVNCRTNGPSFKTIICPFSLHCQAHEYWVMCFIWFVFTECEIIIFFFNVSELHRLEQGCAEERAGPG